MNNNETTKSATAITAGDIIRHEGNTYSVIENKTSAVIDFRSGRNCRYIVISEEAGILLSPSSAVEMAA